MLDKPLATFRTLLDDVPTDEIQIHPDPDAENPQTANDQVYKIISFSRDSRWHTEDQDKYGWAYDLLCEVGYNFDSKQGEQFLYDLTEYNEDNAFDRAVNILHKHYNILFLTQYQTRIGEHTSMRSEPDGVCFASYKRIRDERGWKVITKDRAAKEKQYMQNEIEEFSAWANGLVYWVTIHDIDPQTGFARANPYDTVGDVYADDGSVGEKEIRSLFGFGNSIKIVECNDSLFDN